MKRYALVIILVTVFAAFSASAQFKVKGLILSAESRSPLADVQVQVEPGGAFAFTNKRGEYQLGGLRPGRYVLQYKLLGRQSIEHSFNLHADTVINVSMDMQSLGLDEVSVIAQPSRIGSSSLLEKSAIRHTQPASLIDALQLIPGQLALNPDLSGVGQINLRQVPSSAEASRANALGTAIILDGVPFSNNANMQTSTNILNAAPGALPPFASSAGRGLDLRQIPADQIESIEVIRGIPSAKYGDLTAGAILVNTRAGIFKPEFTTRLNPNLFQQSAGFGTRIGQRTGIISLDADLAYGNRDPRDELSRYARHTAQATWSKPWLDKKLFTTVKLAVFRTRDQYRIDTADRATMRRYYSKDAGFRLSSNGKYSNEKSWFSLLSYDAGLSYTAQESYLQEKVVRDVYPITDAIAAGRHVARFGESEYLSEVSVSGRPVSAYGRLEANVFKFALQTDSNNSTASSLIAGAEYRHDVNHGSGRQFNPLRPPRQNYSTGDRPRTYAEIPALRQLAYYLENRTRGKIAGRNYDLQLGLRYDNVGAENPFSGQFGNVLAPRLNFAIETFRNLRLKAGYGRTAKSPTLSFLYPGNRYYDLQNFNYYANNPQERLVVLTTHVRDLTNTRLRSYTSEKAEFGLNYTHALFSGFLTGFRERTRNAFGTSRDVQVIQVDQLTAREYPPGSPPVLNEMPSGSKPFFAAYDISVNNRQIKSTGLEFQIETKPISGINTSFDLSGAWIKTQAYDNGEDFDVQQAFTSADVNRISIVSNGYQNRQEGRQLNTSMRFVTRLPALKFLISGLVQTVWNSSNESFNDLPDPIGYLDNSGNKVYLSPEQATSGLYEDLRKRIIVTGNDFQRPLWLFNLRATKEFRNGSGISFYVNNVPANRGIYYSEVRRENLKRNQDLFFGAEFTIKI